MPELVRQVITLASPFRDVDAVNVPRFLAAGARAAVQRCATTDAIRARLREPLTVPTTAIVSRTDAIASWRELLRRCGRR